jgi:dipeptidyl aminopeptidase/acylaminoacyl peptidase
MSRISKLVSLFLLLGALLVLLPGLRLGSYSFKPDSPLLLTQDLNGLRTSDGKIIRQRLLNIDSEFRNIIDCYKIEYLSDGLKVIGFVSKPREIDSKVPVILFNRGGCLEFGKVTEEKLKYLSLLASKGYVILASQYRGNDGGEGHEEFGGRDVNDVMNLIPLAKSLPFVDPGKMVMLGYSRGGMMTYLAMKEGAPIKAAAIVSGISDLFQVYQKRGQNKILQYMIGRLVGFDTEEYRKRSACFWPERITVPLLILHGEDDPIVDVGQAKKMREKMHELEKICELIVFPKSGHGLNTVCNQRDRKIMEWFAKYR